MKTKPPIRQIATSTADPLQDPNMETTEFESMRPYELGETRSEEAIPFLIRYLDIGSSWRRDWLLLR